MPIARVPYPAALPTVQNDYVLQNNLLITNFYRVNEPSSISGANVTKGAVFQIGGVIYYCTADTAIGGAASNYVKIAPDVGGATCTATYVANLVGVAWNQAYNGYYDVGGSLYVFDEGRALQAGQIAVVVGRYVMQDRTGDVYVGRDLQAGRDVVGKRNVDIRGDSDGDRSAIFASDASILWDESEDEFVPSKNLYPQNGLQFDKTSTSGSQAIGASAGWTPTAGFYTFGWPGTGTLYFEVYIGKAWHYGIPNCAGGGFVYCDGSNMRIWNYNVGTATTVYWIKYSRIT